MLNDREIHWWMQKEGQDRLVIDPYPDDCCFQPTSVDLHLSNQIRTYPLNVNKYIDLKNPIDHTILNKIDDSGYMIQPGVFILASTIERIEIPSRLVCLVEGKSKIGRAGLLIHITAGLADPNFKGNITLEMKNVNNIPIKIYPNIAICQVVFEELSSNPNRLYGHCDLKNHFQNSIGTVGIRGTL